MFIPLFGLCTVLSHSSLQPTVVSPRTSSSRMHPSSLPPAPGPSCGTRAPSAEGLRTRAWLAGQRGAPQDCGLRCNLASVQDQRAQEGTLHIGITTSGPRCGRRQSWLCPSGSVPPLNCDLGQQLAACPLPFLNVLWPCIVLLAGSFLPSHHSGFPVGHT